MPMYFIVNHYDICNKKPSASKLPCKKPILTRLFINALYFLLDIRNIINYNIKKYNPTDRLCIIA